MSVNWNPQPPGLPRPPQLAIRDVYLPVTETAQDDAHPRTDSTQRARTTSTTTSRIAQAAADERAETAASTPESASQQVAALQSALHEKDELLHALTAQLEEAANRLDRLHRAGADRSQRSTNSTGDGHGGSAEFGEQLAKLTSDWDELQMPQQFEAIRNRLDDILDAVTLAEQGYGLGRPSNDAPPRSAESPSSAKLSGWEDMKRSYCAMAPTRAARKPSSARRQRRAVSDSAAEVLSELPLEPPQPVDIDSADRDVLAVGVEERDVFILHLIRRLRSGRTGRYAPINWAEISKAPDELRERLQEHEARLQELLRMEECDLSLERCAAARERSRLEQMRRDVERDARDNGDHQGNDADRSERRWLRVFGFGRKPDGDM